MRKRFSSYITAPFQQFSIEHINYFSKYSVKNLLTKFLFKEIGVRQDENKLSSVIDPYLSVLSQKTNDKNSGIIKDDISGPGINDYVRKCLDVDIKMKKTLQDKLLNKNKIIVWGVGTHTQRLIGSGLDISRVLYFVDSNVRYLGKRLKGIEIKSPRDIREDNPILISTCSCQKEIAYQIEKVLKLDNEVIKIY